MVLEVVLLGSNKKDGLLQRLLQGNLSRGVRRCLPSNTTWLLMNNDSEIGLFFLNNDDVHG